MAKDAVATMGALLPNDVSGRDAVHVAVFSAQSTEKLFPGQDLSIESRNDANAVVTSTGTLIGIVDPFIKAAIPPGERFWVYLYPRTITALSHKWSHPSFEATDSVYATPDTKLSSEQWLRNFCAEYDNEDYDFDMMKILKGVFDGDHWADYITIMGSDANGDIPIEVWHHCSIVFGKPIPKSVPTYFSCSC